MAQSVTVDPRSLRHGEESLLATVVGVIQSRSLAATEAPPRGRSRQLTRSALALDLYELEPCENDEELPELDLELYELEEQG